MTDKWSLGSSRVSSNNIAKFMIIAKALERVSLELLLMKLIFTAAVHATCEIDELEQEKKKISVRIRNDTLLLLLRASVSVGCVKRIL